MDISQQFFLKTRKGWLPMKYDREFWALLDKLVATHKLVIDRPKGTAHPRYDDYIYPFNYGYLEGTSSSDSDGIDVWIGSDEEKGVTGIISSVDIIKSDSEIKILYNCTPEEIRCIYDEHNRSSGMKGLLNMRGIMLEDLPNG